MIMENCRVEKLKIIFLVNESNLQMINNILIEVYSTIAQQEIERKEVRQREGIEAARANGVHLGRVAMERPDNYEEVKKILL